MLADGGDLLILVLFGIAAAVGGLVKSYREAKSRAEKRRQGLPGTAPPVRRVRKVRPRPAPVVARVKKPKAKPARGKPKGLREEFAARDREAAAASGVEDEPKAKPARGKPKGLREEFAARDREAAAASGVEDKPKERVGGLSAILASARTDLEKAILMTEILGRPVSRRDSPVPRFRN